MTTKTNDRITCVQVDFSHGFSKNLRAAAARHGLIALGVALLVGSTASPAQAQVGIDQCPKEIKPATPMPCPCIARTNVTFRMDVTCMNDDGIIVEANGITIRLNGFRLQCTDPLGYGLSCQGGEPVGSPAAARDVGITINGRNYVTVRGGGAIQGFDTGVLVSGASSYYVNIEKLNVTGPDADLGTLPGFEDAGSRPDTEGILVDGTSYGSDIDIFANSVDNHTAGIKLQNARGVEVTSNFAHDNNGGIGSMPGTLTGPARGIHLLDSSDNKIHNNLVVDNGVNIPDDSGIMLTGSAFNRVHGNNVSFSNGDGIAVTDGSANNVIDDNQILYNTSTETIPNPNNTFFDLVSRNAPGANTFDTNNRCETQSNQGATSPVPAGVCKSGEGEAWTRRP